MHSYLKSIFKTNHILTFNPLYIDSFVLINTDSLIDKPANYHSFSFSYRYYQISKRFDISFTNGFNIFERWYFYKGETLQGRSQFAYAMLRVTKSLPGKYKLEALMNLNGSGTQLPNAFDGNFVPLMWSIRGAFNFGFNLKKEFTIGLNHEWFRTRIKTEDAANFTFSDLQIRSNPTN